MRVPSGSSNLPARSYNRRFVTPIMNAAVLRVLDANANRAREALRVIEDYARFVFDDDATCGELKGLRHDLMAALSPFVGNAILYRDTPGDVGTGNKTSAEL